MVNEKQLVEMLTEQIVPLQATETENAKKVDAMIRGPKDPLRRTQNRDAEKATLRELSHTSLLALIIEYSAQQIVAEGFATKGDDVSQFWLPFDRNGIPSKQGALWKAMLSYGVAYGMALPGRNDGLGENLAYMRGFSPKTFGALYGDPVDDEFPTWAWRLIPQTGGNQHWRLYDDTFEYFMSYEDGVYKLIEPREHGLGVCPVVKFTNDADLDGNAFGEPTRFKRDAARHDKTVYDRLSIQHYNSWRIRTAIKMDDDLSEEERARIKLKLAHDDILIGTGDTEFGTLDQTDLGPMTAAQEADRDLLAAVSQTPVWAFNGGSMVNLSADALVEAKSGNRQKVWNIQRGIGRPMCAWARLAALAEGRVEDSLRFDLTVNWADIGSQSLAAAADALGKLAVQLGVPTEMLWEMIPGVSDQTVQKWRQYADTHLSGDEKIAAALVRQAQARTDG